MKANECPRYHSCSSAFCPVSMEGFHLNGEAICEFYRDIYKHLAVPSNIDQAIKDNEEIFLSQGAPYGTMSDYRTIAKNAPERLWGVVWERGIGVEAHLCMPKKNTPGHMTTYSAISIFNFGVNPRPLANDSFIIIVTKGTADCLTIRLSWTG